jgi:hypothetical protein
MNGGIRYKTIPAARYNWVTQRLMTVWTANTSTSGLDVYYSFYPCLTDCNFWSWKNRVQLATVPTNDQFMPAIDFGASGEVLVSFYDRRDNPPPNYQANLLYNQYVAELQSDGTNLQNIKISAFPSDPTLISPNWVDNHFLGDYQDAWIWSYPDGRKLASAWIGIPFNGSVIGDVYVSRTAP